MRFSDINVNDKAEFSHRITQSDIDKFMGNIYNRDAGNSGANSWLNDSNPTISYIHTAITTSVTVKRILTSAGTTVAYLTNNSADGIQYTCYEVQA